MTHERRSELFSKDAFGVQDIMELLDVSYGTAAMIIRNIKRRSDRLKILGKIHVQDYLDYFNLGGDRYVQKIYEMPNQ